MLACAVVATGFACAPERDRDGLGPAHAAYVTARDARPQNNDATLRSFYAAYLEGLRTKDPAKALRFYRPDAHPEARNAIRMGLEFIRALESVNGEILELRDLGGRALLRAREQADFKVRNRVTNDRRDRTYQLVRVGRDWYIEPPDLGAARKRS
jgi:hypothetical protein